jgi:hypothetical protein
MGSRFGRQLLLYKKKFTFPCAVIRMLPANISHQSGLPAAVGTREAKSAASAAIGLDRPRSTSTLVHCTSITSAAMSSFARPDAFHGPKGGESWLVPEFWRNQHFFWGRSLVELNCDRIMRDPCSSAYACNVHQIRLTVHDLKPYYEVFAATNAPILDTQASSPSRVVLE